MYHGRRPVPLHLLLIRAGDNQIRERAVRQNGKPGLSLDECPASAGQISLPSRDACPLKRAVKPATILPQLDLDHHSACPAGGRGTTFPSTGLPSTISETALPGPARLTAM